jgi:hypothetical protein
MIYLLLTIIDHALPVTNHRSPLTDFSTAPSLAEVTIAA